MRTFCLFFSFYILVLSLQPCGEMTARAEMRSHNETRAEIRAGEQKNERGEDCSPFCVCSCCHFSTAYQFKTFSVTNKIIVSQIVSPENSYRNPYNQNHKTSVWQPPKFNSLG